MSIYHWVMGPTESPEGPLCPAQAQLDTPTLARKVICDNGPQGIGCVLSPLGFEGHEQDWEARSQCLLGGLTF